MISVTAYCNGFPLCFGRGETEADARKNAQAVADEVGRQFPRLSDPAMWKFERDAFDRQILQPAKRRAP